MKRGERKPAPILQLPPEFVPHRKKYFARVPESQYVSVCRVMKTYFIQGDHTRLIKIGRTMGTVRKRLEELQPASPDFLRIIGTVPRDLESHCHQKFVKWRLHGEWFYPAPELLLYIQQLTTPENS